MWEHPRKDFMVVDKKIMKEVQYLMIELQLFFPLLFCKNELTGGREVQGGVDHQGRIQGEQVDHPCGRQRRRG